MVCFVFVILRVRRKYQTGENDDEYILYGMNRSVAWSISPHFLHPVWDASVTGCKIWMALLYLPSVNPFRHFDTLTGSVTASSVTVRQAHWPPQAQCTAYGIQFYKNLNICVIENFVVGNPFDTSTFRHFDRLNDRKLNDRRLSASLRSG